MQKKNSYIHLSLLLIIHTTLHAQQKFEFRQYFVEEGLSQNSVWAITQDYQGFMWFGTFYGLNRFDGYSFKIYKNDPEDSSSLTTNHIETLYEDSKKNLWVGTGEGLNYYNRKAEKFEYFMYQAPIHDRHTTVKVICEGKDKKLLVGGWQGITYVDSVTKTLVQFRPGLSDNENTKPVFDLIVDKKGNLWAATNQGLDYYDFSGGEFLTFHHQPSIPEALPSNEIQCLMVDSDETLWVGTRNGISFRRKNKNSFERLSTMIQPEIVNDIIEVENHLLLIGSEKGLYVFDKDANTIEHYIRNNSTQSLSDDVIKKIYQDREKNIWLGTYNGLNLLKDTPKFVLIGKSGSDGPGLENPYTISVLESNDGSILIGTALGIEVLDVSSASAKIITDKYPALASLKKPIVSLAADDGENTLISTWPGEIYLYTSEKKSLRRFPNPDSTSNYIPLFFYGKDNTFWISGKNSIHRYNMVSNRYDKHETFENHAIHSLYQDRKGNLWIGSQLGLIKYDPLTKEKIYFKREKEKAKRIEANAINAFYEDSDGMFWIGSDQGLFLVQKDGIVKGFRKKSGFADEDIKAILEDSNKNLWLSTDNGLYRFNKQNFSLRKFDISDGLQGKNFHRNAALKTMDGKMIFGGPKGFNIVDPEHLTGNHIPPNVVITDFKILNQPIPIGSEVLSSHISVAEKLTLDHTAREFSLEFVGLNFSHPQKVQYAYKMEGF